MEINKYMSQIEIKLQINLELDVSQNLVESIITIKTNYFVTILWRNIFFLHFLQVCLFGNKAIYVMERCCDH